VDCAKCRTPLLAGAKFCTVCGRPVGTGELEVGRRQLTLLFSELVGSTALSKRLDPEDFRDLLASYHRVCRDAVDHYEGHVSQFLGDGVMAYFGYPVAHEDDTVRAVLAGLRILDGLKLVNDGIGKRLHSHIHARVGLHAGETVVGEIGPGGVQDRLAVGETVNLASRVQSSAADDTVVVTASTAKLIPGHFELESLGEQKLKGFTDPIELFRVVRSTGVRTKFEASARGPLTPHVGRERESGELAAAWQEVVEGADRVVVIRGEPGIGKSRIVHHFRQTVLDAPGRVLECFCSPLMQATAFAPIIEMLDRRIADRARGDASPQSKLEAMRSLLGEHSRFAADAVPLMAALLSVPGADEGPTSEMSAVRKRARTLEVLREWAESVAERVPLAILVEDAHWADPSTLDFLDLMVHPSPGRRTLVCATCRPEFAARWSGPHVRTIELSRFNGDEIEAMITHVAQGHALPPPVLRRIAERSEGVPLFVEEVTKAVLESAALRLEGDRYELAGAFDEQLIPSTVQASLLARFDRLGASRGVAQLGAAIGRAFAYPLLKAVAGVPDDQLRADLGALCRSELAFAHGDPPNSVYTFKHALIQDAIYGTLLKSARARVHERIFVALQEKFPERITDRPEVAAYHAENAGRPDAAVPLLREAGMKALGRTAVAEAVKHLGHAIDLVGALEEPARTSIEIDLQAAIGPTYMATLGWAAPEVERSSARLRELATSKGDGPRLFQSMWGLWTVDFLRGRLSSALTVAHDVLNMALASGDPLLRVAGHHAVGYTHFYRGEYAEALRHADEGLALFDLEREKRLVALFQFSSSCAMWTIRAQAQVVLGLRSQADESLHHWAKLTNELRHPGPRAHLLCQQCFFFHAIDDVERVFQSATASRALSLSEGFALWVPIVDIFLAWTSARRGNDALGAVATIRSAMSLVHRGLTRISDLELATVLAETLILANRPQEVAPAMEETLAIARADMQGHYEPELFRMQGEAAKAMGDRDRASAFYRRGIESAQRVGAKGLQLRSAVGLARLGGGSSERAELKRLIEGFSEGIDQPSVREALALL
jgi:class 3 adenylate cyclase/tetratricopeptide (TPR) repeat protein